MYFQFTPFLLPLAISTVMSAFLAYAAWKRVPKPGAMPTFAMLVAVAIWTLAYGLQLAQPTVEGQMFWGRVAYLGIVFVPVCWLVFVLQFIGLERWITIKNMALLMIHPLLIHVVLWTDQVHHQFYLAIEPMRVDGYLVVNFIHGPAFWVHTVYSYILLFLGTFLLFRYFVRSPDIYRQQSGVMLVGALVPWLGNIIYIAGLSPFSGLDLTPFTFTITGLTLVIGLSRFRLLDLTPIVRNVLIENFEDGLIVLDRKNRVVDINPSALQITHLDIKQIIGQEMDIALPILGYFLDLMDTQKQKIEAVPLEQLDGSTCYFDLQVLPLYDNTRFLLGRLLILHDNTQRRVAEQKIQTMYQTEHQQRQLAEVLRQTSEALASTLEQEKILDLLLEQVRRMIPADVVHILLVRDDLCYVARSHGLDKIKAPEEIKIHNLLMTFDTPNIQKMKVTRQPYIIADVNNEPDWLEFEGTEYIRSWLGAPIFSMDQMLGYFSLDKCIPNFFTPQHAELMAALSGQAGLALQNSRLYESESQRAEEAETLRDAVAAVSSNLNLDEVLNQILTHLARVVKYHSAAIFMLDKESLIIRAGRGFPNPEDIVGHTFPSDDPLFSLARSSRNPIILEDAQKDTRFHAWGNVSYIHGWMGVPLIAHGEVIGMVSVDNVQVGAYKEADAILAQAFANEAAIAIENARLFQQVERMAITEPLTGLNNRRYFFELAQREFLRARRYSSSLTMIMMDLDGLKKINDTYGHLAGDQVLAEVARVCKANLRSPDIFARYAGDEFIAILPETTEDAGYLLSCRLIEAVSQIKLVIDGSALICSISIGVAGLDDSCPDLQTLVSRADQALYSSKQAGKHKSTIWKPDISEK